MTMVDQQQRSSAFKSTSAGGDLWALANMPTLPTVANGPDDRGNRMPAPRQPTRNPWRQRASIAFVILGIAVACWQAAHFANNGHSGPSAEALANDIPYQLPGD